MAYRGRLIFPVLVDLYRLDLSATNDVTNSADGRTVGLDPDYKEPIVMPTSDRKGASARQEMAVITLPAQMEPESFNRQMQVAYGDQKSTFWGFVFHFPDLEKNGLVNSVDGTALIAPNDRVGAIRKMKDESLIQSFPMPPGLFVIEATPIGIGIGGDRNLLLVKCQSRN